MTYEIVQSVWKLFTSIFAQEVHQKMILAAGVSREVEKFASNFKAILAVLNDAQAKEMEEAGVREWLNKVKDISYDIDDVLDEYNTMFLKLQNEKIEKDLNFKVKVCFFFYFPRLFSRIVSLCRQIAIKIKEMNKRLDAIAKDRQIMRSLSKGNERFELKLEHFGSISPSHFSSYNSLESKVKQCLLYCAIFPKGYIINMDHLIRLWMAQGFLGTGHNKEMEIVSQKYLDHIITSSFFQECEKDGVGNVISYKIDDTLYDSLQILSKDEHLTIEGNSLGKLNRSSLCEKVCHLSWFLNSGDSVHALPCSHKRLRSLFIEDSHNSLTSHVLPNLLSKFTCLRALEFNTKESSVDQRIPQEIGKLVHLRYLKISDPNIRNLPKTLYELYNLQCLDLEGCKNFEELSQDIGKLTNLRYLNFRKSKLRSLPEMSSELHNLKTLDLGECEELEKLPQMTGKLTNLRYLNLCKSKLRSLPEMLGELYNLETLDLGECEKVEELPQAIGKLTNLKYLNLCKLNLRSLPEMLSELHNLETLDLGECEKLEELPQAIGKLTNLRYLNLCKLKLRSLPEMLSELHNLETLNLSECEKLEELPQAVGKLTNMRHLNLFKLKLRSFSHIICKLYNMQSLDLGEGSNYLPEEIEKLTKLRYLNLELLKVHGYKGDTFPSNLMTSLVNLKVLELSWCINYKHLPPLGKLMFLESLNIIGMESVRRVGNEFWGMKSGITSSSIILFPKLKYLRFWYMNGWEAWDFEITSKREEVEHVTIMPSLTCFSIAYCPKLKALPDYLVQSTTLKELIILDSSILEDRYSKEKGEDWAKISLIPTIRINRIYVQRGPRRIIK